MDVVLLAVALGAALAAGMGAAMMVAPGRGRVLERIGVAAPLGFGFVSIAMWLLGYMVSGPPLRWIVLAACFALLAAGMRGSRTNVGAGGPEETTTDWRWSAAFAVTATAHTALVAFLSLTSQLNWDGLLVWEFKGRIAAMNGGVIPDEYFTDRSRTWTHPYYPPFYTLLVAWIYGWLGEPHQQLVKSVFPLVHGGLLAMLFAGGARLAGGPAGLAAVAVLCLLPEAIFGLGGVVSGYLDYTLAAFYFPAVVYVALIWRDDRRALAPLAAVCAVLPLVKQEGLVLWGVVTVLAAAALARHGRWRATAALAPGLLLFAIWRIHLVAVGAPPNPAFSLSARTALDNLDRVPLVIDLFWRELRNGDGWGLLWPAVLFAIPGLLGRRRSDAVLLLALAVPVLVVSASFLITNWDVTEHVTGSLPRLFVQVAPVAALVVALGLPQRGPRVD